MPRAARKTKHIVLLLTIEEHEKLQKAFESTTCRFLSEYMRYLLLQAPVTVRYRNQSADDFLPIALGLKKELTTIAALFAASLRSLESGSIAETAVEELALLQVSRQALEGKVEEIIMQLHKIHTLWSSKSKAQQISGISCDTTRIK